jgi:hypothetical protein
MAVQVAAPGPHVAMEFGDPVDDRHGTVPFAISIGLGEAA